ncbi:glycosyltransferase family 2 protein [Patescibacteria group bacterium]|nr:glycosyltransferase family 2 protein [Patescibacteria group bacterium]MBU4453300.1 glycosyltransferase family 2 protein [Patescibacteria group bacterium]MCG2687869.1 glycosyltransferase family 2 protein [Candidatus Parcubacteria bacterium]
MDNNSLPYGKHRFWEMIPGILIWTTFILAIWASFFAPQIAVIFIIIFDLYWTLRVLYFLIFVVFAYFTFKKTKKIDWYEKVKKIKGSERIYHVVLLPTYKEDYAILRDAVLSIKESVYRNDRFILVLGGEEADKKNFIENARKLLEEFDGVFNDFISTIHPAGIPGEMPGKGSNLKWMEQEVQKLIDKKKIKYEDILVTAFDVDTIAHPLYYARLSYLYLTCENPTKASYQPVVLYSNNVWRVQAPIRVSVFGTTFWLMSELMRSDRMWTFSSHSMTWQMLVDVGFHEPNLVSEDSRIFLQGFIRYNGDYRVEPLFLPVYMDAVEGTGYWDGMKALYKQQRRWAWGVEHLPYMLEKFKGNKAIPLWKRIKYVFNHIEGMYTWATAPMLIFVLGYLPYFVLQDTPTALLANSPFTLERMMQVATLGVFASAFLSLWLLPKRPAQKKRWWWLVMILQWALLPVTFIVFGAFPAIDAQTRMMIGKYLGFNVTKKQKRD